MNNQTACIFNIQKYSIHDGPGIRTVVFFKGCHLKCLWCSNPESQYGSPQLSFDDSTCDGCLNCLNICPQEHITLVNNKITFSENNCIGCLSCVNACPKASLTMLGKFRSLDYIMKEIMKDKDFYEESNGGVTLSGGDALVQHEFAITLLKLLKEQGIHTACETTGYATPAVFKCFIENVDLLLFDIKHYDSQKHYAYTNVYNETIILNLKTAINQGKDVIIRIPVIPGFNNSLEDAQSFCMLLKEVGAMKLNLLPFHQFGQKKYSLLNKEYKFYGVPQLHEEDLLAYKEIFIKNGLDCIM
ncbi:MAG TPA: glycyl-radical enzyme activating protein [Clostridium sp.]